MVKVLIAQGADVNEKGSYKDGQVTVEMPPLMSAAASDDKKTLPARMDVVKLLISKGADVNADCGDGYSVLMLLCLSPKIPKPMVELFISQGADVNGKCGGSGPTPLMYAAGAGRCDLAQLLLAKGAKVNDALKNGMTALMAAALKNRVEMVKLLLKKGADVNMKNTDGNTALAIAVKHGFKEVADVLRKNGAKE